MVTGNVVSLKCSKQSAKWLTDLIYYKIFVIMKVQIRAFVDCVFILDLIVVSPINIQKIRSSNAKLETYYRP